MTTIFMSKYLCTTEIVGKYLYVIWAGNENARFHDIQKWQIHRQFQVEHLVATSPSRRNGKRTEDLAWAAVTWKSLAVSTSMDN